jgi:nucleotide-binding universal stress UspA family protein
MYKHILVAVDGSKTSDLALRQAITLAKEQSAALLIVHAFDANPIYMSMDTLPYVPPEFLDSSRRQAEALVNEAVAFAREQKLEADGRVVTVDGPIRRISDCIEDEAERWPADLIVIGTHGRRGFSRMLLGSVAEHLIRIASKPVLLIRSEG